MTEKVHCWKCQNIVRLRNDGMMRKHKLSRPTSWARGPQPYCPASEQEPKPTEKYLPLPFNAILSPDGTFYRAAAWQHYKVAEEVTGEDWDDLVEKGWLRLSMGMIYYACSHQEPTQAQIDAIADYAQFMGWDIDECFDIPLREKVRELFGLGKAA